MTWYLNGTLLTHANIKGFGLTPLSGGRHGYMPPLLKNPSLYNIVHCFAGSFDKQVTDQSFDVPSIIFFHNFIQTWGTQIFLFILQKFEK